MCLARVERAPCGWPHVQHQHALVSLSHTLWRVRVNLGRAGVFVGSGSTEQCVSSGKCPWPGHWLSSVLCCAEGEGELPGLAVWLVSALHRVRL